MVKALLLCITVGLIWQFVLVVILIGREQGTLRWLKLREALWLRAPRSPTSGRVGGWLWLILIPLTVAFAAEGFLPGPPVPNDRDWNAFLESDAGQSFLSGNWVWFGVMVVLWIFDTVLGVFELAKAEGIPTYQAADRVAERRLGDPKAVRKSWGEWPPRNGNGK